MFDLAAIGEILIDFTMSRQQEGPPLFTPNPGGAPANVACALAKWGRKSAFIGKVGPDAFGALCRSALQDAGVEDVSIRLYPGARHEILNETNRAEVYADILAWCNAHCKRLL